MSMTYGQKNAEIKRPIRIVSAVFDVITILYFVLYICWIFIMPDNNQLDQLFTHINPMTVGSYFMGISVIVHLIAFKNIIGRFIICIPYIFSVIFALVAIMGATGLSDLIMYIPHVVIICVAIIVIVRQKK